MKEKTKEIVTFQFRAIPLHEAQTMVLAGDGNYADLKAEILKQIPLLPEDQAFSFGLPENSKDEITEDQRRGICHALNITMNRAGLHWRATYSGIKKLFIVLPKSSKSKKTPIHDEVQSKRSVSPTLNDEIIKLRNDGMKIKAIAKQLKTNVSTVHYVIYQKSARAAAGSRNPAKTKLGKELIARAKEYFGTDEFTRPQKMALCKVACDTLGVSAKAFGPLIGMSRATAQSYRQHTKDTIPEVSDLIKIINQGGK